MSTFFSMKRKKRNVEITEVEPVRLKARLGMQPGLYLTIIYAIALLLILFLLLILPGIRRNGTVYHFSSTPSEAAVYVDDVYIGSTPFSGFVDRGSHTLRIEKPFFESMETELSVEGRIFGTLLFPRKEEYSADLNIDDSTAYLRWRFKQIASWSLVGGFYEGYSYPRRSVTAVEEYLAGTDEENSSKELYDFLYMLLNNISSSELLGDISTAFRRAAAMNSPSAMNGADKSDPSAQESLSTYAAESAFAQMIDIELLQLYEYMLSDEDENFPTVGTDIESLRDSLRKRVDGLPFKETYAAAVDRTSSIRLEGSVLLRIDPPDMVPVGNPSLTLDSEELTLDDLSAFPHMEKLESYYLSTTEITRTQFIAFLAENPEWGMEKKEALIADGLVDAEYLAFMNEEDPDLGLPITHVSWHAARAYCDWLQEKLPASLQGRYKARLPKEAEWEYAAGINGAPPTVDRSSGADGVLPPNFTRTGRSGFADLTGNVWEWCENCYFTSDLIDGQYGPAVPSFKGLEKAVRGGSWVQNASDIPIWKRGAQPPYWCSEFVGFRVALSPLEN